MVKAKKFILHKYFDGLPKPTDVKVVEEELPELKDGDFLAEAVYLSVDPYMRKYLSMTPLGSNMIGQQVALVKESKNPNYPVGKYIVGLFGWRTLTISDGKPSDSTLDLPLFILPDFGELPLSLALGALGMPGNTAYFGFLELCKPKPGETVVVSGAAGAVGSQVGQIAKIKGCKVIGIAGSDEKGKWLTKELGFDHVINYKTQDIEKELKKVASDGVDCYFDNVGGEISTTVLNNMNLFGRVSVCGSISSFAKPQASIVQSAIVSKQLTLQGFRVTRWADRWMEGIQQNLEWIKEGKLKYRETITDGFDNMLNAFIDLLQGGNTGKAIVKV